jgi:hypothetical protein
MDIVGLDHGDSMPDAIESHLGGDIFFVFGTAPVQQIGPYRSNIHLIEHAVSGFAFAYGVADCDATALQFDSDYQAREIKPVPGSFFAPPLEHRLRIELESGRTEWITPESYKAEYSADGCQIAFMVEIKPKT